MGPILPKEGTETGMMVGQTLPLRGGQPWRHQSAQDQQGRKASGEQASEGPEAAWPTSPQPDPRVKYEEGEPLAQGAGRQENRSGPESRPYVSHPGLRPIREATPAGYWEGHPDKLRA